MQTTLPEAYNWVLEEAEYAELSESAVGKVQRNYSQRSVAMQYIEVYNEAMAFKSFHL